MSRRLSTPIHAVLFDLDGTLVDSHGDLCNALNRLEEECGNDPTPHQLIRPHVSQGAMKMICVAFDLEFNKENLRLQSLWKQMIRFYREDIASLSMLFNGMPEVLDHLQSNGIAWGVVTNKPEDLSCQLLAALRVEPPQGCVVGGDTLPTKKPEPGPLLHACQLLDASPEKTVYVGDDPRDAIAGKRAGMATIAVRYGYHMPDNPPELWGADYIIDNPIELMDILSNKAFDESPG
ncbi:MAG: HAD-IA family hydrolase [Gammaproteobacteria bacterium]|nr:HAD-IA family hydrolase [Gammaproteobacteria bacterium]